MADLVDVNGLDQTLAALRALPTALSGKNGGPIRKALFASAKVVREEAKQLVRVRTGNVRENIILRRDRTPQNVGASERYQVTLRTRRRKYANTKVNKRLNRAGADYTNWGNAFYGKFLEFGTSKMPAYPFLRPAFEAKKNEAVTTFAAELQRYVADAVALARKGGAIL